MADNAGELSENLFSQGLVPLSVREVKPKGATLEALSGWMTKVKAEDLMIFTRQFYTLFKAGVSMDTILGTIGKQMTNHALKNAVLKVRTDVAEGSSLAQAFGRHPRVFNELYVSLLAAGEEAGILEEVLSELVKLIEKEDEIKRSVKAATLYPKIVIFVLIMAVSILISVVVPKFTSFYSHYGADLPIPTQILIGTSNFIRGYWYIVLIALAAIMYSYNRYYRTKSGRFKIDRLRFKLPVFGELTKKIANARYGRILAALYKSGIPMPRALEVVANVIGNHAFALEVRKIRDRIQKGSTLSESMTDGIYFPPVIIETTAVGEKTGSLDEMLEAIADHYDLEVRHTIKNLTTLLEPILLVLIFAMVAILALSIFLPIWNMSKVVGGG